MKQAEADYRALVMEIGFGFHPDTRVADYSPALPRELAARYEGILEAAAGAGIDLYEVCASIFEKWAAEDDKKRRPTVQEVIAGCPDPAAKARMTAALAKRNKRQGR